MNMRDNLIYFVFFLYRKYGKSASAAIPQRFRTVTFDTRRSHQRILRFIERRSSSKSSVPKPVTYGMEPKINQRHPNKDKKSFGGRTGSHPEVAVKPVVSQPGLEPDIMSVRPGRPLRLYSQGLRKPSGVLPVAIR